MTEHHAQISRVNDHLSKIVEEISSITKSFSEPCSTLDFLLLSDSDVKAKYQDE